MTCCKCGGDLQNVPEHLRDLARFACRACDSACERVPTPIIAETGREEAGSGTRICTSCGQEKPLREFARHRTGKYGRSSMCKDCTKAKYGTGHGRKPQPIVVPHDDEGVVTSILAGNYDAGRSVRNEAA